MHAASCEGSSQVCCLKSASVQGSGCPGSPLASFFPDPPGLGFCFRFPGDVQSFPPAAPTHLQGYALQQLGGLVGLGEALGGLATWQATCRLT